MVMPGPGVSVLPLSSVARLEEFPRDALEKIGARHVVQYDNEIMPLIDVSRVLKLKRNGRAGHGFPPRLGQDTAHVLEQVLGYTAERVADLTARKIVGTTDSACSAMSARPWSLMRKTRLAMPSGSASGSTSMEMEYR